MLKHRAQHLLVARGSWRRGAGGIDRTWTARSSTPRRGWTAELDAAPELWAVDDASPLALYVATYTLEEIDLRTGGGRGRYEWNVPNDRAYGERSNITPPILVEGTVFWAQLEPNDVDQLATWELVSAPLGGLGGASVVADLVEPYSLLATPDFQEQVLSPHMRFFGSRLIFDGEDFLLDANVDYWSGFQMKAANDTGVRFSTPPVRMPYETRPVSYDGIVRGDLLGFNTRILPSSPRSTEPVWPSVAVATTTGHGVVATKHFGLVHGAGGAFSFYEGKPGRPGRRLQHRFLCGCFDARRRGSDGLACARI